MRAENGRGAAAGAGVGLSAGLSAGVASSACGGGLKASRTSVVVAVSASMVAIFSPAGPMTMKTCPARVGWVWEAPGRMPP